MATSCLDKLGVASRLNHYNDKTKTGPYVQTTGVSRSGYRAVVRLHRLIPGVSDH
jgi:hypothetical protein